MRTGTQEQLQHRFCTTVPAHFLTQTQPLLNQQRLAKPSVKSTLHQHAVWWYSAEENTYVTHLCPFTSLTAQILYFLLV